MYPQELKQEELKYKLINWIVNLNDSKKLEQLMNLLQKEETLISPTAHKRTLGFGKGTYKNVADDFDEPLDDFKEYMP
ncbi:MAG: hypothetical protein COZ18_08215 [Flexibacter sp. CG_4_10_14_3_um_filter_32_15]|nr:MAG: hypothetical protein COZ18_08215 [Flexibacter sp. CG_4_10_14_3_um_filter_32_15]PJB20609.1 MAG: hypothetical protein CO117_00415 [Flavobacteriaceae bacterium CG_4_9_14_3_um_filter_33_16]